MLILKDTTLSVIFYKHVEIFHQNIEINVIHIDVLRNAFANIIMKFIIFTKLNFGAN